MLLNTKVVDIKGLEDLSHVGMSLIIKSYTESTKIENISSLRRLNNVGFDLDLSDNQITSIYPLISLK
jgi:hypothetical protein